jgi:hypothetical protein
MIAQIVGSKCLTTATNEYTYSVPRQSMNRMISKGSSHLNIDTVEKVEVDKKEDFVPRQVVPVALRMPAKHKCKHRAVALSKRRKDLRVGGTK